MSNRSSKEWNIELKKIGVTFVSCPVTSQNMEHLSSSILLLPSPCSLHLLPVYLSISGSWSMMVASLMGDGTNSSKLMYQYLLSADSNNPPPHEVCLSQFASHSTYLWIRLIYLPWTMVASLDILDIEKMTQYSTFSGHSSLRLPGHWDDDLVLCLVTTEESSCIFLFSHFLSSKFVLSQFVLLWHIILQYPWMFYFYHILDNFLWCSLYEFVVIRGGKVLNKI